MYLTKEVELKLRKIFKWATDKVMGGVVGVVDDDELIEKLNNFNFSSEQKREIIEKLTEVVISTKKLFDSYRTLSEAELKSDSLKGAKKWIKINYELMTNTGGDLAELYQKYKERSYETLIKATKEPLANRFERLEQGTISNSDMKRVISELKKGRVNKEIKEVVDRLEKGLKVNPKDIAKLKEYGLYKVELRARNEAGNLYANELQAMMLEEDIQFYRWRTMEDSRVRQYHVAKDNKIFNINEGTLPGQDFGCRCWAEPVKKKGV